MQVKKEIIESRKVEIKRWNRKEGWKGRLEGKYVGRKQGRWI